LVSLRSVTSRPIVASAVAFVVALALVAPLVLLATTSFRAAAGAGIALVVAAAAGLAAARSRRARKERDERDRSSRALVESLPLVTWQYDAGDRARTRLVTPQIASLTGFSPDEWSGDLFERVLHRDDRQAVRRAIDEAAESGAPFSVEYRLAGCGGDVVWVREEGRTIRAPDGTPLFGQSFLLDIGERKRIEEALERLRIAERDATAATVERQGRLDLLRHVTELAGSTLDTAAVAERAAQALVRDLADWCIVDVTDEGPLLRRVAVARAEPGTDGSAKSPAPEPGEAIRAVVESGRAKLVPEPGADTDEEALSEIAGDVDAMSIVSVPMRTRRRSFGAVTVLSTTPGKLYGADELALVEDVAGRVALAMDRARLHHEVEERSDAARVLAHVADGVLLLDRGGVVRLWNPAAEGITAIPAAEVVGRLAADAFPGWQAVTDTVPISSSPDPGHAEVVIPIETSQGERWIAISGVSFFAGTVYAFRDLTEVRRLEMLKADFIATASHELRTPLAAVYGAAQTLLRHDFALDEGGRDRFVSLIAQESERLGRIVNEILLANQLDAGRVDFEVEPFDAAELIDRVVEATRAYAPPNVTVERFAPTTVPRVDADREKVRQVLANLVENAIKYSPDGGRVEIGLEPRDETVLFYVKDEGLGIPPDEQSRVFEKFYRLDPEMTRGVGGTGLGLYICNELVNRMGGHIWVDSKAGEGSTFLFELAAATTASPARDRIGRLTAGSS
jgi:two-component system phosphate regulon sensor histidine kinase PhoR